MPVTPHLPGLPPSSAAAFQPQVFALPPAPPSFYPPPLNHSLGNLDVPFDPLTDLSYSSDLLSFFESLEPAVDPANFISTSADWLPDLPPPSGSTTPLMAPSASSAAMGPYVLAEAAAQTASSGSTKVTSASKTEGQRLEEQYAEDRAAAIPVCELNSLSHRSAQLTWTCADHALNDGFFASLPPPVREVVKARMMDVAFSNE